VLLLLPESGKHLQKLEICCEISRAVEHRRWSANKKLGSDSLSGVIQPCPFATSEARLMGAVAEESGP